MRALYIAAFLLTTMVLSLPSATAQDRSSQDSTVHDSARHRVLDTVQRFFDAMQSKDAAALRDVLSAQGVTHALRVRGDSVVVVARPHDAAIASITGSDAAFMERMFNPVVHVDDHIAVVWTPYDFHVNGNFSHCGTDVFNLIRVRGDWKIASVTYTVEQENCPDRPPLTNSP